MRMEGQSRRGRDADYEEFLALRKHVRKLQQGTPLLLNTLGGQDDLQICAFQISQDLQTLMWRECEGNGSSKRLPLSSIASVKEISVPKNGTGGEGHFALQVRLREDQHVPNVPKTFELICTSKDDLEAWQHGLLFLMGDQNGDESPSTKAPETKLKDKEELCERLQQENNMLKEMIKRKDATIAELLRDSKSIKTESTSRESDEHLQFREVAILRRKNKRLQNELKSKQHTISGLLKLVERLSQQADETSAQETAEEEPEICPKQVIEVIEAKADDVPSRPSMATGTTAAVTRTSRPAAAAPAAPAPQMQPPEEAKDGDDDAGIFGGELAALADKLQMLERAAAAATQGVAAVSSFQPPPRNGAAGAAAGSNGMAVGPGRGPKSTKALEVLQREFNALEEKKRLVQHLAHTLEPEPSDSEDDGFPLR